MRQCAGSCGARRAARGSLRLQAELEALEFVFSEGAAELHVVADCQLGFI